MNLKTKSCSCRLKTNQMNFQSHEFNNLICAPLFLPLRVLPHKQVDILIVRMHRNFDLIFFKAAVNRNSVKLKAKFLIEHVVQWLLQTSFIFFFCTSS